MLRRLSAEWTRLGHDVIVLTTDLRTGSVSTEPPAYQERLDDFAIERLHFRNIRWVGTLDYVCQLNSWVRRHRDLFDVAYVSMFKHAAFATTRACVDLKKIVVLRAEGAGLTGDMAWQKAALGGAWIAGQCQRASAFIAPSQAVHAELIEAGYDAAKTHLFENAVPVPVEEWSPRRRSVARLQLGLSDIPTIVYTGRLHADKCLDDLLNAVSICNQTGSAIQCCIVGAGPELQRLRQIANRRELTQRIQFAGQVDNVQPYLHAADAFVLPSRHEGLSVALLEALAAGVPAVASEIDAHQGLFPANDVALVPVNNVDRLALAIQSSLAQRDNAEFRNQLRNRIASRFGLPRLANLHLELFSKLNALS